MAELVAWWLIRLEPVSKLSQSNEGERQVYEAAKDVAVVFVSHEQAAEAMQPTDGSLHNPTPLVTPHLSAIVRFRTRAVVSMRAEQLKPIFRQVLTKRVAVIGFVGNHGHAVGQFDPVGNCVESRDNQFRFRDVGRGRRNADRNPVGIRDDLDLDALADLGFSDFVPPFCAGVKVASAKSSSVSTPPFVGSLTWRSAG